MEEAESPGGVHPAIDVIEHVVDVENFLTQSLAHVKENGLLIISTGNPDCFFWKKVFKAKFWYSLYSEHVTFPDYKYYLEFSIRQGLQTPEQKRIRYTNLKPINRLLSMCRFSYSYAIYKLLKTVRRIIGDSTATPTMSYVNLMGTFTDHHVIIFKKMEL